MNISNSKLFIDGKEYDVYWTLLDFDIAYKGLGEGRAKIMESNIYKPCKKCICSVDEIMKQGCACGGN